MDTKRILSELKVERDRLDKAIAALESLDSTGKRAYTRAAAAPAKPARRRHWKMSAAGRKRLSEMMKKRWAERKKGGRG